MCEGIKRYPTRKVDGRVVARRLTKGGKHQERAQSALLQSQQLLQQQDYAQYQIKPNLVRRNSKEWVPEYKKERIESTIASEGTTPSRSSKIVKRRPYESTARRWRVYDYSSTTY